VSCGKCKSNEQVNLPWSDPTSHEQHDHPHVDMEQNIPHVKVLIAAAVNCGKAYSQNCDARDQVCSCQLLITHRTLIHSYPESQTSRRDMSHGTSKGLKRAHDML
jgi:hypothetical protein